MVQIGVLLNLDALEGASVPDALLYDLGHGYCANKFYSTCPHRMACARCSHYRPKPETLQQLAQLERSHARFTQTMNLRKEELAALNGDDEAVAKLLSSLEKVPSLDGSLPGAKSR
jgi:hypothetical protein